MKRLASILLVALCAIWIAFVVYASGKVDWLALQVRLAPLQRALAHGWYVDDIYAFTFVRPLIALSTFFWRGIDVGLIDAG